MPAVDAPVRSSFLQIIMESGLKPLASNGVRAARIIFFPGVYLLPDYLLKTHPVKIYLASILAKGAILYSLKDTVCHYTGLCERVSDSVTGSLRRGVKASAELATQAAGAAIAETVKGAGGAISHMLCDAQTNLNNGIASAFTFQAPRPSETDLQWRLQDNPQCVLNENCARATYQNQYSNSSTSILMPVALLLGILSCSFYLSQIFKEKKQIISQNGDIPLADTTTPSISSN